MAPYRGSDWPESGHDRSARRYDRGMSPRAARHTGVLAEWSDERGFGFVEAGGRRTFVHISAFDPAGGRPQSGDFVQFEVGSAPDGRPCAVRAARVYASPGHAGHRPARRGAIDWVAFLPVLAVAAYLWLAVALLGAALWYPLAHLVLSVLAYLLYAGDKRAAVAGTWRTPERTLLLASLLGGWPGAVVAQQVLRHKNRKTSFQVAFWLAVAANLIALLVLTGGVRLLAA